MGIVNTGDANKARFRLLLEGSQAYGHVRDSSRVERAELISFKV